MDTPGNIGEILVGTAALAPHRTAIVEGGGALSYGTLARRAGAVAATLRQRRIATGDRVAIWAERRDRAAAAFFGAVSAGGIAVIVNEALRPRQVEHILSHSGARFLLVEESVTSRQPRPLDSPAQMLELDDAMEASGDPDPVRRLAVDPAQIIFTSGSTGLPKGVTVSHGNLRAGIAAVTSYVGIGPDDRIASLLPFSFDYGFNQLLCAVGQGATLVVERSPLPASVVRTLRAREVTVLPCVPPLWMELLAVPSFTEEPVPSIRAMTNTGGHLPVRAVRRLRAAYPAADLFLMYGLTEAFRGTWLPPDEVDRRPHSIGKAIPGCEILVLRPDGTECAPGEPGELVQRGATVALGYWNDPEATDRTFRADPTRPPGAPATERVVFSGDTVKRDEDGFLTFVSRGDAMIKSLGYRISPDEIVDVLHASGEVADAAVAAEPDDVRGSAIVAWVVLVEGGDRERLRHYCQLELPRYMLPTRIVVRDTLPRTTSGKHDVRALMESDDGAITADGTTSRA